MKFSNLLRLSAICLSSYFVVQSTSAQDISTKLIQSPTTPIAPATTVTNTTTPGGNRQNLFAFFEERKEPYVFPIKKVKTFENDPLGEIYHSVERNNHDFEGIINEFFQSANLKSSVFESKLGSKISLQLYKRQDTIPLIDKKGYTTIQAETGYDGKSRVTLSHTIRF